MTTSEQKYDAIQVRLLNGGIMTFHKDSISSVEAIYSNRNIKCNINGIQTISGYDFVIKALGWKIEELP